MVASANTYPYVVVGLGKTGLSCCRYLKRQGIPFAVVDSRATPSGLESLKSIAPGVPVHSGSWETPLLDKAKRLLMSPGIDTRLPVFERLKAKGTSFIGDISLFAEAVTSPVIAITGSNGKSTVTRLLTEMLKATGARVAMAGNIGIPVLDVVDQDVDYFVLELSSFQLDLTTNLQCCSAVVLNVSPDHLDRYASYAAYTASKRQIYQHCTRPVINLEQPEAWEGSAHGDEVTFALNQRADFYLQRWNKKWFLMFREGRLMEYGQLSPPLKAFPENVLAALALAYQAGSSLADMIEVIRHFKGLPHRCEEVAVLDGVRWIDDAKATNTGSAIAAVERFGRDPGGLILIAGGQGKGADFTALGKAIDAMVAHVILLGEDAPLIAAEIHAAHIHHVDSMEAAVLQAHRLAKAKDTVLLAPACASFDMFLHFSDRGEQFQACVQALCRLA